MLKKWFKHYLGESHCNHKYIFIKMQDNEDFKKGTLGVVYPALTDNKPPTSKFSESKEVRWGINKTPTD
ncbi:hypothetical protein [Bacillus cereus]|uniref:hypothetical protein n=1 Tax=Bacillus cereus TaxID=1396 RepID=UPI000B4C1802|nr:hypothetical protein [Bacillus cereus]